MGRIEWGRLWLIAGLASACFPGIAAGSAANLPHAGFSSAYDDCMARLKARGRDDQDYAQCSGGEVTRVTALYSQALERALARQPNDRDRAKLEAADERWNRRMTRHCAHKASTILFPMDYTGFVTAEVANECEIASTNKHIGWLNRR